MEGGTSVTCWSGWNKCGAHVGRGFGSRAGCMWVAGTGPVSQFVGHENLSGLRRNAVDF